MRPVTGMAAVLLPFADDRSIDWTAFEAHVARIRDEGLVPAVNMDTGFGALLSAHDRDRALGIGGPDCVCGVYVDDAPGANLDLDAYRTAMVTVRERGGTPIVFPSWGLKQLPDAEIAGAFATLGQACDRFLAFELGEMFLPQGRIFSLETFEELLAVPQCIGMKHSSLRRQPEWDRLEVRDRIRPEFMVLTGNDRAIDMMVYGSDYLLGLATFAPDWFATRDRAWEAQDLASFWEANDLLQYLGQVAFRDPVPAYRHSAAQFLKLRGWIDSAHTHSTSPCRPESDVAILTGIFERGRNLFGPGATS